MNAIITQLLQLSRISHHSLKITEVRIDSIAADFLAELRTSNPQRKVHVLIDENITVRADESLMQIALKNLIRNAWKYSSKCEDSLIEIGIKNVREHRHFFVKDNGTGFDMKDVQRIFEPFQRAHSEKEYKGTGIGLSIVKRIIEKHNGRIWAESKIGKGACFYFTLP
jgi:signal transduction histidine kinase